MAKKSKLFSGPIPFDREGNMLSYDSGGECVWLSEYDEAHKTGRVYRENTPIKFNSEVFVRKTYPIDDPNYPGLIIVFVKTEFRENKVFEDTMQITGFGRGRSSAVFYLQSKTTGRHYSMFMTHMAELITTQTLVKGLIHGSWCFAKRGSNYGIQFVAQPQT